MKNPIAALCVATAFIANAQLLVSANDNTEIMVDGVHVVVPNAAPDTLTLIDLGVSPPKTLVEVNVPASWSGPPQMVAVAPDETLALVANSLKLDPTNPQATIPDDLLTVVDLKARPPRVTQTLHAGKGANGIAINRAGTMALVANRLESSVSVFAIHQGALTKTGTIALNASCGPSMPAFSADGKTAYITCTDSHQLAVLSVSGSDVVDTRRLAPANPRPVGIEITPKGDLAIVANVGNGPTGGVDTISVMDLSRETPRVVDSLAVGIIPEGLALSPKGDLIAVMIMNGTTFPQQSPDHQDFGLLKILRLQGGKLSSVADARIGHWCQGVEWSQDQRTVVVQCIGERQIQVFRFDGSKLTAQAPIPMRGGPVAMRTARR